MKEQRMGLARQFWSGILRGIWFVYTGGSMAYMYVKEDQTEKGSQLASRMWHHPASDHHGYTLRVIFYTLRNTTSVCLSMHVYLFVYFLGYLPTNYYETYCFKMLRYFEDVSIVVLRLFLPSWKVKMAKILTKKIAMQLRWWIIIDLIGRGQVKVLGELTANYTCK